MTFQVFNALKLDKIAKSVSSLMIACFQVKEQIVYLLSNVSTLKVNCITVKDFVVSLLTITLPCIKQFNVSTDDAMTSISQRIVVIHGCTSYLLLIPVTVNTYVLSLSLPTPMFLSLPTTVHTHAFVTVNIYFCH